LITSEANQTGQSIKSFSKIFIHCVYLQALNFGIKSSFFTNRSITIKTCHAAETGPAVFIAWYNDAYVAMGWRQMDNRRFKTGS